MAVNKKNIMTRYFFVVLVMGLLGIAIVVKAAIIMFAERQYWQDVADRFIKENVTVKPNRGNILSSDGKLMASSLPEYRIYMDFKAGGVTKDTMLVNHMNEICEGLHKIFPDKSAAEFKSHLQKGRKKGSRNYLIYPKRISYIQYKEAKRLPVFNLNKYKGREFGGSLIRPEATGYGNIYFLMEMLKTKGTDLKGKTCLVSGSGNVAQYTVEKVIELGGKVVTMSDSDGYIYDPDGIDREKLDFIMELKNLYRGRIREYAEKYGCKYVAGARPWGEKADIALPSATQNELNGDEARQLVANGVMAVSEGANMPSTPEAIRVFQEAKILYAPGKAANAGGVSVSGLEMTQNSIKLGWSSEEVDEKLKSIMKNIHTACVQYGTEEDGYVNYVKGANIAGFMKVAKAMMAQGIV